MGIDSDDDYLAQARFAAEVHGAEIEFRELSVYRVAQLGEKFDLVIFMGVLYHLRHPLLALDLLHEHAVKDHAGVSIAAARQRQTSRRSSRIIRSRRPRIFDEPGIPRCISWSSATRTTRPTGGFRTAPARRRCCAARASRSWSTPRKRSTLCEAEGRDAVVEAVMFWNEPNNLSHWNFEIDPEWQRFATW